jgi:hypothetical protein
MRRVFPILLTLALGAGLVAPALGRGGAPVYTDFSNVFTVNQRINAALGINVAPGAASTVSAAGAYFERSRSVALGEWTQVAYNAGNFSTSSAALWTVDAGDQAVFSYMLVGKTITVSIEINTSTVSAGGTAGNLRVVLPGGFVANKNAWIPAFYNDGSFSGLNVCAMFTNAGSSIIGFNPPPIGVYTWPAATNVVQVRGTLSLEVQ